MKIERVLVREFGLFRVKVTIGAVVKSDENKKTFFRGTFEERVGRSLGHVATLKDYEQAREAYKYFEAETRDGVRAEIFDSVFFKDCVIYEFGNYFSTVRFLHIDKMNSDTAFSGKRDSAMDRTRKLDKIFERHSRQIKLEIENYSEIGTDAVLVGRMSEYFSHMKKIWLLYFQCTEDGRILLLDFLKRLNTFLYFDGTQLALYPKKGRNEPIRALPLMVLIGRLRWLFCAFEIQKWKTVADAVRVCAPWYEKICEKDLVGSVSKRYKRIEEIEGMSNVIFGGILNSYSRILASNLYDIKREVPETFLKSVGFISAEKWNKRVPGKISTVDDLENSSERALFDFLLGHTKCKIDTIIVASMFHGFFGDAEFFRIFG